jgi:hypothetical protein
VLGSNYPEVLQSMMQQVTWTIQLPPHMERFFQESGLVASLPGDERRAARLMIRTRCILLPEAPLPAFPRPGIPAAVYTSDLSRNGIGFLSPYQYYPEEDVRLILPTMWLRGTIARSRRLGPNCFQIGARLISKHDPDMGAFSVLNEQLCASIAS